MSEAIYSGILNKMNKGEKQLAVLIDPDKFESTSIITIANTAKVDYFFVGGSLMISGSIENCIAAIRKHSTIPIVIFPGSTLQVCDKADGILLVSLLSGRNPDLLIGQHVVAAPFLKQSGLEILPTGYLLIDSGKQTTASYISGTTPIPHDKSEIAACTAMAGEMLGFKLIYLDGGSGAVNPVSALMIKNVKRSIAVPLIVGGGIKTIEQAESAVNAGADIIVVGNAIEKDPNLLPAIAKVVRANTVFQN